MGGGLLIYIRVWVGRQEVGIILGFLFFSQVLAVYSHTFSVHVFFLKTKTKFYGDEATDFYVKKIPKVDSNHPCLAVFSLEFSLNKDDNYYPQVFLKEFKYIKEKLITYVGDNFGEFPSSDESDNK